MTTLLHSADDIANRIQSIAKEVARERRRGHVEDPLLLVCILRGAFIFTADLMRALHKEGVDAEVDFLGLSSYEGGTQSLGRVRLTRDLDTDVAGRDVLVIDDILDSGRTLSFVKTLMASRNAARVRSCVLLDKPERREVAESADFVGFTVPDRFVTGYGMDIAGKGRGAPYIGTEDD